jgi:hypothetical protein
MNIHIDSDDTQSLVPHIGVVVANITDVVRSGKRLHGGEGIIFMEKFLTAADGAEDTQRSALSKKI